MNRSELFASILMEKNDEKLHKQIEDMSERDAKYLLFTLTKTVQKHATYDITDEEELSDYKRRIGQKEDGK